MWEYTDKVREHFLNPRNVGELEDANAIGEVGSLACGDALKLYLKIDADERIVDAKFQTFGCASAIASSSALTEMLKGRTVAEAEKITNKEIAEFLGGLPQQKMHCSVMGQEALEAAIKNWRGEEVEQHEHEGELVCKCFGVTDELILRAIRDNNLTTVEEVTHFTKAGGGCGDCIPAIQHLLDQALGKEAACEVPEAKPKALTNVQRMQLVVKTLEEEIRPSLQKDGGDIELVDIDGHTVKVALRGMCTSCPSSQLTLKGFVERTLREYVEPEISVVEVNS
ncbi:Fe-S cluster assembly protein NifU [Desulfovibrio subterraneus]|uniref:Nitrogen fixation protein NifU n=1 Tax=Desulfovibrio subterraneus TaxID=2718620 RepID=A0A7J0BEQ3_9BACT|nr:Fe-S cluster assembly protein NifU [Desulfovibrio subterraneus]WBF68951.1 Fe-S cluster assembly protein NifU [Desulfovibrio subterraneus]GFM32157.1 nitrogen fixation protein NifU [Desulfovibrio subterraneus]